MLINLFEQVYHWNAIQFSNANGITAGIAAIFVVLAIVIFIKVLKIDDVILIILGNVSFSIGCIIRGFMENTIGFYLSSAFIGMMAIIPIGTRSKLSKIVNENESGKVFSFLSTCETISPVLGSLLYAAIFSLSVNSYLGLTYHFSAALTAITIVSLFFISCQRNNQVVIMNESHL